MGRWLVILSLAVVQCPDIAMASSKSSDLPLWKRLLSAFKPAPPPAHPDKARLVRAAVTPNSPGPVAESQVREPPNSPEPVAGSQLSEPPKSNRADCNGIISSFYSPGQRTARRHRL